MTWAILRAGGRVGRVRLFQAQAKQVLLSRRHRFEAGSVLQLCNQRFAV